MTHISEIIENILVEWAYRVHDGMPNPKNAQHIHELRESMEELNLPNKVIYEVIQNLINEEENPILKKTIKYKTDDGEDKEGTVGGILKKGENHPAYKQARAMVDKDKPEKKKKKDKKVDFKSTDDYLGSKDDEKSDKEDKSDDTKSNEELINQDHEITDSQLNMTKTKAKEQATKKGSKDVGAGTPASRAGEAMVHKGLRMLKEGKSIEEIQKYFDELVNSDDHILNSKEGKKWVKASISTLNRIDEEIGIDNIKNISWDTKVGREAIGVDSDLETSSDMFVQTNDGSVMGLSLKKSGAVFLANKGWPKESKKLLEDLKPSMSEEAFNELEKSMSIKSYNESLNKRYQTITEDMDSNSINEMVDKLLKEDDKLISKYFGSGEKREKYLKILRDPKLLEDAKNGTLSGDQKKVLAKITAIYDKDKYNHLREVDSELTANTFKTLNKHPEAQQAMKKHIVKSMHIAETLGLNKKITEGGVDGFMTLYGIEPDGAVLNEEKLVDLFGSKFASTLAEVRNGTMTVDDLEEVIMESIEMDYETGNILFKHENENKYPLFFMKARTRGLGSSPTMEMAQTNLMAFALKFGTFDSTKWPDDVQEKFKDIISQETE